MKFAVVGSGVSGLSIATILSQDHEVVLYEKDNRFGGHSNTIEINYKNEIINVDTGFIVFNKINYPHLMALFDELNVPICQSNMSFGASVRGGEIEYGLRNFQSLFAQPRNLKNFNYLKMLPIQLLKPIQ